ncbi:MAG: hypothetical protein ACLQAT_01390 [Candidatus Binataceae bacterium]
MATAKKKSAKKLTTKQMKKTKGGLLCDDVSRVSSTIGLAGIESESSLSMAQGRRK